MKFDVFISHASEDKDSVARPLSAQLELLGLRVWLDECQLTIGDSLRQSIDKGLSDSKFGVVILSHSFFDKKWPNMELDGLISREDGTEKVILPVWHQISASDIVKYSPILAGKIAVSTSRGLPVVAKSVLEAIENSKDHTILVQSRVVDYEEKLLSELRSKMLTAETSWQLKRSVYELDEHLARYPHSPEALMLKDQMAQATLRAQMMEIRPSMEYHSQSKAQQPLELKQSIFSFWTLIFTVSVLAFLAYYFFFSG